MKIVSDNELVIKPQHIYGAGLCARGARDWFARYGLSWADFVASGLPAATLEATGDALALQVVAHARVEVDNG